MSRPNPPAGHRLVTPADREAHPLVPEGALVNGWLHGEYMPSANAGLPWSTMSNYLIPIGLWPERDPAPEPATVAVPLDHNEQQAFFTANILRNWDRDRIESFARHLLGSETVSVPADLAEEIAGMLDGRAADVETRADGRPWPSERALAERLRLACDRIRACPGYGADGARTVRKEAT